MVRLSAAAILRVCRVERSFGGLPGVFTKAPEDFIDWSGLGRWRYFGYGSSLENELGLEKLYDFVADAGGGRWSMRHLFDGVSDFGEDLFGPRLPRHS